ncbi:hypothetical protein JTB14_029004 [Gonioctena quinquepunctata]|nr:hypothetical protein JTB14_029004 [Gonioctena quinquepunctata]
MNDIFMNDTFDNFAFTQTEQVRTVSCSSNRRVSEEIRAQIPTGNEISFNDSAFVSELSLLQENVKIEVDVKIRKTSYSVNENEVLKNCRNSLEDISYTNICKNKTNKLDVDHKNVLNPEKNLSCRKTGKYSNNRIVGNADSIEVNGNPGFVDSPIDSQNKPVKDTDLRNISAWGLPEAVVEKYRARNLKLMFPWQAECLGNENVVIKRRNLIYSAPTSAGKTLVAEILAIKTVFEMKKKVVFIVPFVSIVREKMYYFQDIFGSSGIRVEGFMGSYNPPGGFGSVQVAICTIEKANSLINRLLEEKRLSEIGAVLVDEMHLLGDPSRGYLLELLLTKLKYISKKDEQVRIQIIGMSATLPNLKTLAKWLDAELFTTSFRPIPLIEQAQVCGEIYDKNLKLVRKLSPLPELGVDTDNILQLCLETIKESCSILIFCPTKNWCENLAQQISTAFLKIGSCNNDWGELLRSQLNTTLIMELLEQLKYCPVGLDEVLRRTVSFGVAFHHAGLTMDERDIIEGAFRNGALRVLVATSTLSSGVNLPARRVIIRTPNFHGKPIDTLTYRQMIGRAGRMGKDTIGESFLICQKNDYKIARELMSADLRPVSSCLEGAGKLKRAILEVIASGVASTPDDVDLFTKCTLLAAEDNDSEDLGNPIEEAVGFLKDNEFIRLQEQADKTQAFVATSLGKACLSSSMAPDEGLALFTELEKARQCFVLDTELHLIYLITPYSACHSWGTIDWMFFLDLWEKLPSTMKKVGELVGVRESYIVNATRGKIQTNTNKLYHKLLVHKRFFVALALQDLVNEKPLNWVCNKFNCNRGMLQSLQQSASSFAGMVTCFSRQLGWSNVELLISQFQDRMQFGVSRDLLDLMHLPILNGKMARTLFNAGIESLIQLANSDVSTIENILHRVIPFETEKEREGESEFENKQRNKYRNLWVTGKEGLTEREAADMFVTDARNYLKLELGLAEAKWEKSLDDEYSDALVDNKCGSSGEAIGDEILAINQEFDEQRVSGEERKIDAQISSDERIKGESPIENYVSDDSSVFSKDLNISDSSSIISDANSTRIEDDDILENKSAEKTAKKFDSACEMSMTNTVPKEITETVAPKNIQNCLKTEDSSVKAENISNFTSSFSDIDFSSLEQNININSSSKETGTNTPSKVTYRKSNTNEVSQLLSPNSVELSISGSLNFSSHDNCNISVQEIHSDQSLFDESLHLHLSESDGEPAKSTDSKNLCAQRKENSVTLETASFLEEAFTGSFDFNECNVSDDDIFAKPLKRENSRRQNSEGVESKTPEKYDKLTETLDPHDPKKHLGESVEFETPTKYAQSLNMENSRKRVSENVVTETPTKKLKSEKSSNVDVNTSYIENKLKVQSSVDFSKMEIVDICQDLSLLDSFCKEVKQQTNISLSVACKQISENKRTIGINIPQQEMTESENSFSLEGRKVEGFCFAWERNIGYYISLENPAYHQKIIKMMKSVIGNEKMKVRLFDAKEQIKVLKHCCGIHFRSSIDDPKIADWILDPEGKEKNLKAMAVKYCPEGIELAQLSGGCKGVGSVGLDLYSSVEPKIRSAIEAILTWHLVDSLKNILREENPEYIKVYDVETDTLLCLASMEIGGISVSKILLQELADNLKNQLSAIESKAFSLAGRRFNFVSSTEVAKVIGLFRGRRISTKKQILEKNEHPISDMILQWRKINSTLTKMIYPLIRITKNDCIHGCYVTHTSTGRITMHEPNLQNLTKDFIVPNPFTKDNVNISCRSAFQVPDAHSLLSADYCQLELRILTHFSQDKLLCHIMNEPGDVFKSIASKWNKVEEDKVTDTMRQSTKNLCYGIIYGMGSKTLADQLDLDESEAIEFMETFKNTYPGIKKFIKEAIEKCQKFGYVETITGRKRYLPSINDTSFIKRGQAERQAVNTIVQGSAADIAKKAMVEVEKEIQNIFCKTKNRPRLVLHLHDEIIYEVPTKYIRKVAKIVKKNMEHSVVLSVPFPVKLKTGKSWGSLSEFIM